MVKGASYIRTRTIIVHGSEDFIFRFKAINGNILKKKTLKKSLSNIE